MHMIRLEFEDEFEDDLLAWLPPSFLLFSSLLRPFYFLALIFIWSWFEFLVAFECAWPRGNKEERKEVLLLLDLVLDISFSLFLL